MAILPPSPIAAPAAVRRARSSTSTWTLMVALAGVVLFATTCGKNGIDVGALCPGTAQNPGRTLVTTAMTPKEFCGLFLQTCSGDNSPRGGYTTEDSCEMAYTKLMSDSTRECRSYHLCNSAEYDSMNQLLHCGHAVGIDLCADTAP
jgi:hypothetical protein